MTDREFEELVQYVSDNIEHDLDRYAFRIMNENRCGLDYAAPALSDSINYYAEEWCSDNDIDEDEYYDEYGAEEVFMHDRYAFDS